MNKNLRTLIIIFKTVTFGRDLPGYPSLMVTILFIGGIQLMALGVMGEYLGRVFNETKQRPLYFVQTHLAARSTERAAVRDEPPPAP